MIDNKEIADIVQERAALWTQVRVAEPMQQVRRIMREANISVADLAERMNEPAAVIESVLLGDVGICLTDLYSMADALEVPLTLTFGEA